MAIDSLNNISNEQLLAMNMQGNGQVTNDDASTDTTASDESNLAFQLVMKNLIESKKSNQNVVDEATKIVNNGTNNKTKSTENSNVKDDLTASNINRAIQTYAAGQKLEDIPMMLNNKYFNYANNSRSMLANRSDVDMKKIYGAVDSAAKKYGVDSNLILAIIKQESDFDPNSTSDAGAIGLMQIMPENFSSLGIKDGYNVKQNIDGGTKLLKEYLDQYHGNMEMALMAYNGGPGTMQRRGVSSANDLYKMPEETQNYVPKVIGYYNNGI